MCVYSKEWLRDYLLLSKTLSRAAIKASHILIEIIGTLRCPSFRIKGFAIWKYRRMPIEDVRRGYEGRLRT